VERRQIINKLAEGKIGVDSEVDRKHNTQKMLYKQAILIELYIKYEEKEMH
jgi:hypothetical protein